MAFITVAGENLIAVKQGASQVLTISNFVFANVPSLGAEPANRVEALPPAAQRMLTKAVDRQGYVNANQVVFSASLDSSVGDFDFNWVGLVADDGTLVACEHIPLTQKRKTVGATPGNNLVRNFLLAFSGATATTAIAVPAATWQIDFTNRLNQIDDRERLANADDTGAGAFIGNGFLVSLISGSNYRIAAGSAYVGGIRARKATNTTLAVPSLPSSIWMDVSLQGDLNGVAPVLAFSQSSAVQANFTDGLGYNHFLTKLADIAADGTITDTRSGYIVSQTEAESGAGNVIKRWTVTRVWDALNKAIANHVAATDPHTQYSLDTNVDGTVVRFASGTSTVFYQSAAPTGWVKVAVGNNYALMTGTGGTTGGGGGVGHNLVTGCNVVASHTHDVDPQGIVATTTNNTHSHGYDDAYFSEFNGSFGANFKGSNQGVDGDNKLFIRNATTDSNTHSHNVTVNIPPTTTKANPGAVVWQPQYATVIVCKFS